MSIDFAKSETHQNLLRAFAGESQARNRYTFAADLARQQNLQVIEQVFRFTANQERAHAKVFYDFLDSSKMFKGTVEPEFRSLMNIPFVTGSADLDKEVVAATKAAGYDNLKGHKSVGGLRASIYNAMPKEGVEALVEFLKNFEANYGK